MSRLVNYLDIIDRRWWRTLFWILWLSATVLMLLPSSELPKVDLSDKTEHCLTFFALMAAAWLGYRKNLALGKLALLLIAYGIAIECVQFFIPSRSFSVLDMVADSIGVLPAWWIALQLERT
jgi:VanZ family protein